MAQVNTDQAVEMFDLDQDDTGSLMSAAEAAALFGTDEETTVRALDRIAEGTSAYLGISGKMGAGKDSVAASLEKVLDLREGRYQFSQFARGVKVEAQLVIDIIHEHEDDFDAAVDAIVAACGTPRDLTVHAIQFCYDAIVADEDRALTAYSRTPEIRAFLQYWATDIRREQDPDHWGKMAVAVAIPLLAEGAVVIAPDCRFPNEIDLLRRIGGKVVRLYVSDEEQARRIFTRDGITLSPEAINHQSERVLDDYQDFALIIDTDAINPDQVAEEIVASSVIDVNALRASLNH